MQTVPGSVSRFASAIANDLAPKYGLPVLSLCYIGFCAYQILSCWNNLRQYELLIITGVLLFIFGVWRAMDVENAFISLLSRLRARGALQTEVSFKALVDDLQLKASNWASKGGYIVAIAMAVAFLAYFYIENKRNPEAFSEYASVIWWVILMILETIGSYIAGRFLGRMSSYGFLGQHFSYTTTSLKPILGHYDGVAGLKPVGDFYFMQAKIVSIPAIYLSFWLLVFLLFPSYTRFDGWTYPYIGLLILAMLFFSLSFLLPLLFVSHEMKKAKSNLLIEADKLSRRINDIRDILLQKKASRQQDDLTRELDMLVKKCEYIESMPTWPVSRFVKKKFVIRNMIILTPLIGYGLEQAGLPEDIGGVIAEMIEKI